MKRFITLFLAITCLLNIALKAQPGKYDFAYPLDRTLIVTGNYGELRPNHFHAGLDFSTHPTKNLAIKVVQDGYVSRIKISRSGYGKVLYVTHPNGYVSVYAHQKDFATSVNNYVKQKQYEQQKNEIELFLKPNELPVKKNDVIGYTGNSGSSQAPHLHFEIREEKSEVPVNPLLWYNLLDKIKPTITHIGLFDLENTNQLSLTSIANVDAKSNSLIISKNTLKTTSNKVGIAFSGFDQADGSSNKNNIYEAKLFVDGKLIYHHQLDNISFEDARYVNFFGEKINGIKLQKCFPANCGTATIYKLLINNAVIELTDTLKHVVVLELLDERQNNTKLSFFIKSNLSKKITENKTLVNAVCNKDTEIIKDDVTLKIKKESLTRSCFIACYYNKNNKLIIGQENEIILKPIDLSVKVKKPLIGKESKMVLLNQSNCLTGKYNAGWFTTETKSFGTFEIAYDTIAPKIVIDILAKSKSTLHNLLRFKISDVLSGIGEYHLYVNNTWQIAEYDAKTGTLLCETDLKGKIRLEVSDKVGNKTIKEYTH